MPNQPKLRVGVIGVGHLGRYHAQKYATLDAADLVAVSDLDTEQAARVAAECGTETVAEYRQLFGAVDAVSIAVPARHHYPIAAAFLSQGVHVLLEKPIAASVDEAQCLVSLAERHKVVLQIGHLERFNPAVVELARQLDQPLFIECYRIAPFQPRGTDVSVVLDLMIHDIDLLLALVDSPVVQVDASGIAVLTDDTDIVNARLQFANGCVANVTASRVSAKSEAKLRLFQRDCYFSLDLREKRLSSQRKQDSGSDPDSGMPKILSDQQVFPANDALLEEIEAFLDAVRQHKPPPVTGVAGLRALQVAAEISAKLMI